MGLVSLFILLGTLSSPERVIIGLNAQDLRHTQEQARIKELLYVLDGQWVTTLPYALVVDVQHAQNAIRTLKQRSDVKWIEIEQSIPVQVKSTPNDPYYTQQWYYSPVNNDVHIHIDSHWENILSSAWPNETSLIAVFDDGFDLAHPDLINRFINSGQNFSSDVELDDASAQIHDNHGTQTAGVIAAEGNNNIGLVGVCPGCKLLPIRLIGNGGSEEVFTTGSATAEALVWAVDQGAAILNNSWGPPDSSGLDPLADSEIWALPQVVREAFAYALKEGRGGLGAVIVWSAGNGAEPIAYDGFASAPEVFSVGALSQAGQLSYYSDYGPAIDLVAPSSSGSQWGKVVTTDRQGTSGVESGDYNTDYGGTSAATAMVSGATALIVAAYPHLSAAQIMESLTQSAQPIDEENAYYDDTGQSHYYGHGLLDIAAALSWAASYTDGCTLSLEACGNEQDDNCNGIIDDIEQCTSCVPDQQSEICDGKDNNCNGFVDEHFVCSDLDKPTCAPCTNSNQCLLGSLCRSAEDFGGTWCFPECEEDIECQDNFVCQNNLCQPPSPSGFAACLSYLYCHQEETCDGHDNDCNGLIDDIDATSLANLSQSTCGGSGLCAFDVPFCIDGTWQCERHEYWQEKETRCDGLDNDCDGLVDELASCTTKNIVSRRPSSCTSTSGQDFWLIFLLWGHMLLMGSTRRCLKRDRC
ncbi:MAG: S8 family serine peptidase [Myxococcota bacterium]|jgi:hypothetical protein|nr:S8 family serine peptidase [Myxococcota bacterium]